MYDTQITHVLPAVYWKWHNVKLTKKNYEWKLTGQEIQQWKVYQYLKNTFSWNALRHMFTQTMSHLEISYKIHSYKARKP